MNRCFKAIVASFLTGIVACSAGCSSNKLTKEMIEQGNPVQTVDCTVATTIDPEHRVIMVVGQEEHSDDFYWERTEPSNDGRDVTLKFYGNSMNGPDSQFAVQPDGNHWVALIAHNSEGENTCWRIDPSDTRKPFSTLLVTKPGDATVKEGDKFLFLLVKSTSTDIPLPGF